MGTLGFLRMLWRVTFILTLTIILCICRLLLWPGVWISPAADRRVRRFLLQTWNRGFAWAVNIQIHTHGPVPKPPFFLVSNHLSYLDMVVLTHQTGCIYVSRGDVEHWPIIGFLARSLYIIFVDRKNIRDTVRVNRLIADALALGDAVVIFPESHITVGKEVEPFKSSLIEPAVAARIPVHYATLTYETLPECPPASEIVNWWRPESFLYHLQRLMRHRGVKATIHFGESPLYGEDRKELAPRLHEAVQAAYTPIV